jgi:hypothetical protein
MAVQPDSQIEAFEGRKAKGDWRVEYVDDDCGCHVTIFGGPFAEKRARDNADALRTRKLAPSERMETRSCRRR